eukprot:1402113-Pyramimonas_sp.AAC.1
MKTTSLGDGGRGGGGGGGGGVFFRDSCEDGSSAYIHLIGRPIVISSAFSNPQVLREKEIYTIKAGQGSSVLDTWDPTPRPAALFCHSPLLFTQTFMPSTPALR